MGEISRRDLLIGLGAAAATLSTSMAPGAEADPYRTPYKYGKLVLAKSDDPTSFDSKLVDAPDVFSHNGKFYMHYTGFDGVGYQIGLAESDNLIDWRKLGIIFSRNSKSKYFRFSASLSPVFRDPNVFSDAPLKKVNGRYLAPWHAYPERGYEAGPGLIGLAWSDDLIHWEAREPILRPQDGEPWERGGLYTSWLVEADGLYYLFYNAKNRTEWEWHEQIGVATSPDLKTWTRSPLNPIIRNGRSNSWDSRFSSNPVVLRNGKTWICFYYGLSHDFKARDLLALGTSPLHFMKAHEILIDVGPPNSIDNVYAHKPSIISWRGDLYHFYCAVSGSRSKEASRGISVARSRPWPS